MAKTKSKVIPPVKGPAAPGLESFTDHTAYSKRDAKSLPIEQDPGAVYTAEQQACTHNWDMVFGIDSDTGEVTDPDPDRPESHCRICGLSYYGPVIPNIGTVINPDPVKEPA